MRSSAIILLLLLLLIHVASMSSDVVEKTVPPTCRLPSFTNSLPLNERRELRKIWAGFHSMTAAKKCERQLAKTRELIASLPDDVKLKILDWDKPAAGVGKEKPRTNFLAGLSAEQIGLFSKIMSNRSLTHDEKYEKLRSWAAEYLDLDTINQVEQFIAFQQRKSKSFKEKVDRLSSEARIAHDKLESLRRLKQEVYTGLTEEAKKELANLYRTKCPRGSIYETSDLDADELQLACSIDDKIPMIHPNNLEEKQAKIAEKPASTSFSTIIPISTTTRPTSTAAMTSSTTTTTTTSIPDKNLWHRISTSAKPVTNGKLSFEIEKNEANVVVERVPSRPSMASMFVADPQRLSDLLRKIFNSRSTVF